MFAGVLRGMHAIGIQLSPQEKALRRAGVYAEAATFTFESVDGDFAAWWCGHGSPFLKSRPLKPAGLLTILIKIFAEFRMSDGD